MGKWNLDWSMALPGYLVFLVLAVAICLPAVTYGLFDPGFVFFAAPFLLAATGVGSAVVWFVLRLFRCPARVRCGILLFLSLAGSACIGVDLHHTYTAAGRFERLLMAPIPQSVQFIDTRGCVSMAGGYEVVVFSVDPADFDRIVLTCKFEECPKHLWRWGGLEKGVLSDAQKYGISPGLAYKKGELGDFLLLLADPQRTRAYLYRDRM
jgi:hypothetical protein